MKVTLVIGLICVFFVWFQPTIRQTPAQQAQDSCALIRQALDDTSHIKAGTTRADVEKNFRIDGGLQSFSKSSSTTRYDYLKCMFIKIDVTFKLPAEREPGSTSSTDIVISVSKPYLEYPFTD